MKTVMAPHTANVQMVSSGSVMKNDRRASKPLMEKRRRERINKSLNELKSILLNALRKDQSTCHSKLEKADILEMTVRYLKGIQRQRLNAAMAIDPSVMSKYRSGFVECKNEVSQFLENTNDRIQPDVKTRLMNHLGNNVPQPHIPSHLMGQARNPRLMTTAPPVTAVNAISPLQIQMSPNTQIQQAMAAAAAAMAQNRSLMQQRQHVLPFNIHEAMEQHGAARDTRSPAQGTSKMSPCASADGRSPRHVRHNSGSSCTSSGFASPGSPLSLSPSATPQRSGCESVNKHNVQGSFVLIPQTTSTAVPPPAPVSMETEQRKSASPPKKSYPMCCVSPISPASSPVPRAQDISMTSSSMTRSYSPASSAGSDSDSEPVWRPW